VGKSGSFGNYGVSLRIGGEGETRPFGGGFLLYGRSMLDILFGKFDANHLFHFGIVDVLVMLAHLGFGCRRKNGFGERLRKLQAWWQSNPAHSATGLVVLPA
jgi:hypothetical protein